MVIADSNLAAEMSSRFFYPSPITSRSLTLDGAEAHHLLHVGRATPGQQLTLFDNSGAEFTAVIEDIGRSTARLQITERREVSRELPFALSVAVALPKGDRQKWLVEKLTELGATALVPLLAERGVAQPTGSALDRLRRTVIEASKQCGRNRLMQIAEPQTVDDWITPSSRDERRMVAHPAGVPVGEINLAECVSTRLAIGPEGGFTAAEVTAAREAGWQQVSLGPRILRVETAAVALAAIVSQ
jgi:16S rRNA (uracil1498-N3)-methyltransferase